MCYEILSIHHLIHMAHEIFKQPKFFESELERLAPATCGTGSRVKFDIKHFKYGRFTLYGAAEYRLDSCTQLLKRKRFNNIVICSCEEEVYLMFGIRSPRKHEDGSGYIARSRVSTYLKTRLAGEV